MSRHNGDPPDSENKAGSNLPGKYAIGLDFDAETGVPRVTALGRGRVAEQITETAKNAGVPVEENPEKAKMIFSPSNDRVIPAKTYEVIAEILTFIYRLNGQCAGELPEEPENNNFKTEKECFPGEKQMETFDGGDEDEYQEDTTVYETDKIIDFEL